MSRFGFFNPDPAAGIALAVTTALALSRKPRRQVFTEARLARLHEEAKREDWNRAVEARKAAKRAGKDQP
jgi:hypothetical protein